MKKAVVLIIVLSMLFVSMSLPVSSKNLISAENKIVKEFCTIEESSDKSIIESTPVIGFGNEFGVWIHTKYNGADDSTKLDIDLTTFKLMLDSQGWRQYKLSMQNPDDTIAELQFSKTQIYVEDEFIDVLQTQFRVETSCDTTEDYEISLEVRFPFSAFKAKTKTTDYLFKDKEAKKNSILINILNKLMEKSQFRFLKTIYEKLIGFLIRDSDDNLVTATNSESYFCLRSGFSSPENDEGPRKVEKRFFFGRNSIFDPRICRMKITPSELERKYKLEYFNSLLTVDESGSESFFRTFSVEFEPAAELQTTSILREGKISYDFGLSAGTSTKISFRALGGKLSDIIQSFVIDPLPDYMSFDLTILGERSFKYRSDRSYSVAYLMDSEQEGNLVKLELNDLPEQIDASWGLGINLGAKTASGFVNLDMDKDIGEVALSLYGSDKPFLTLGHFPRSLHLSGFIDVPNLSGDISASMANDVPLYIFTATVFSV